MNHFRTEIESVKTDIKISYNSKILFIGSCFAENIGNYFNNYKFNTYINPFGVIYNPISIKNSLNFLITNKQFAEKDLACYNDLWFSYYHHSKYSNTDKQKCLEHINNEISIASEFLKTCNYVFITLGSAKVYELIESNKIVSNCHKLPAKNFKSYILPKEKIIEEYSSLIENLYKFNPKIKLLFTVSPVRYLSDGAFNNQVSKSTLILSIYEILKMNKNIEYFPAYEMIIDDLRDYRFYKEDMIHPNNIAIKYIWEKIMKNYFDTPTLNIIAEIDSIVNAKNHKPFNPNSDSHQIFLKNQIENINNINKKYPEIDLSEELNFFSKLKI